LRQRRIEAQSAPTMKRGALPTDPARSGDASRIFLWRLVVRITELMG
jgi:hypothetical protein